LPVTILLVGESLVAIQKQNSVKKKTANDISWKEILNHKENVLAN